MLILRPQTPRSEIRTSTYTLIPYASSLSLSSLLYCQGKKVNPRRKKKKIYFIIIINNLLILLLSVT